LPDGPTNGHFLGIAPQPENINFSRPLAFFQRLGKTDSGCVE